MKKILIPAIIVLAAFQVAAQDTFSIAAIDSVTGEVGSAGASCVGSSSSYPHGAAILSDVIPGIGVIHTQAAWNPVNQQYAHDLMMAGSTPQEIIDSVVANDATGNPTTRQYGIADYNGSHPRSAAYTGINCMDYKNHITGPGYSIQGNILMGQEILDSMETRFLNTPGPLADRLMAALQGAKVIGADTRCAVKGTSSQSSFLRVGKPGDPYDTLYCDLWMAYPQNYPGTYPVDPIDSLQALYDQWKISVGARTHDTPVDRKIKVYLSSGGEIVVDFSAAAMVDGGMLVVMDVSGRMILTGKLGKPINRFSTGSKLAGGIYLYRITDVSGTVIKFGKLAF
jgi:uncharacterized Ntn-hydrolase superfamily protein